MNAGDDLELRLRGWMIASAPGQAPGAVVDGALDRIDRVRQRPAILIDDGVRARGERNSTLIRLAIVGLVVLALTAAAIARGGRLDDTVKPVPLRPLTVSYADIRSVDPAGRLSAYVRADPALGRLGDGTVLVAGGIGQDRQALDSALVYDPRTFQLAQTGSMHGPREGSISVTLADGTLLVLGGYSQPGSTDRSLMDAEIYDPATGTFRLVAPDPVGGEGCHCGRFDVRDHLRATLTGDGRVLITGRSADPAISSSADLFDPKRMTIERVPIGCDAGEGTQTALADGRVLIICSEGGPGEPRSRARLFDPARNVMSEPAQPTGNSAGQATLLTDGRVLVTGRAWNGQDARGAEVFDPRTNAWTVLPADVNPEVEAAGVLSDGRAVFLSIDAASSVAFDPRRGAFEPAPALPAMVAHGALPLGGDRVLYLAGAHRSLYLFDVRASQ
jgi:hypothetical protein